MHVLVVIHIAKGGYKELKWLFPDLWKNQSINSSLNKYTTINMISLRRKAKDTVRDY